MAFGFWLLVRSTHPATDMPGVSKDSGVPKKQKRQDTDTAPAIARNGKIRKLERSASRSASVEEAILLLESQILESRQHYNNIATLLQYCRDDVGWGKRGITAAVALCRIFCRLMAMGNLSKPRQSPENEVVIVQWLQSQLDSYKAMLLDLLSAADPGMQSTALTLLMRLLKGESESSVANQENGWRHGTFSSLVSKIISSDSADAVREEFMEKYLEPFDDVRYYAFVCLRYPSLVSYRGRRY